jgi:membrane protein YqaA with SNARE-associated domain
VPVSGLLTAVMVAFVSALLPMLNVETYVGAVTAADGVGNLWLLCAVVAVGQMVGKLVWYAAGSRSMRAGWVRRKLDKPRRRRQLALWQARVSGRPTTAAAVVFAAGSVGLPPLAVISVLAGQLRMPLALFMVMGLAGRYVRFAALVHGVGLLHLG